MKGYIQLEIVGVTLPVEHFYGHERMGSLWSYEVMLTSMTPNMTAGWLGQRVWLKWCESGKVLRQQWGVITFIETTPGGAVYPDAYRIQIHCPLYLLHLQRMPQLWVDVTWQEIFEDLFSAHDLSPTLQVPESLPTQRHKQWLQLPTQTDLDILQQGLARTHHTHYWYWQSGRQTLQLCETKKPKPPYHDDTPYVVLPDHSFHLHDKREHCFIRKEESYQKGVRVLQVVSLSGRHQVGQTLCLGEDEQLYTIIAIEHHGGRLQDETRVLSLRAGRDCPTLALDLTLPVQTVLGRVQDYQQGYRIHYDFLPAQSLLSCPMPTVSPSGSWGPESAWHAPLTEGTLVLTGFLEGDVAQPVIFGALPTETMPSPVTQHNSHQSRYQLQSGGSWVFDDAMLRQKFSLYEGEKSLLLSGQADAPGIFIETREDSIDFTAREAGALAAPSIIGQADTVQIEAQQDIVIEGEGTLEQRSLEEMEHTSEKGLYLEAQDKLHLLSGEQLCCQVEEEVIVASDGELIFHAGNGALQIAAAGDMAFTAEAGMHLGNDRSACHLTADSIVLQGESLYFQSDSTTIRAGQTSFGAVATGPAWGGSLPALATHFFENNPLSEGAKEGVLHQDMRFLDPFARGGGSPVWTQLEFVQRHGCLFHFEKQAVEG